MEPPTSQPADEPVSRRQGRRRYFGGVELLARRQGRRRYFHFDAFGLLFAGLWLLYAIPQIPSHGLTCDSPSLFFAGDRTLFWIEHPGHPEALDFDAIGPHGDSSPNLDLHDPPGFHTPFFPFPEVKDTAHYPVFAGLVAALASQLAGWFGVGAINGHHLGLVLLHAVALYWFTLLAGRVFGRRAGAFAGAMLLCFPAAIAHAFNNAKDWPCVDFYACTMLSAMEALIWRRPRSARMAGIFAGVALSCKINAVFALLSIGGLAAFVFLANSRARKRLDLATLAVVLQIYAIASVLFFVLWPYLYHGPVSGWAQHVHDYLVWYANYAKGLRETWTDYPLRPLLFATPPLVLIGAWFGLKAGLAGRRMNGNDRIAFWFTVAWLALPLLRVAVPHSNFYDGNRHFMEYIPALCLLAGIGADRIADRVALFAAGRPGLRAWAVRIGALAVLGFGLAFPVLSYRPFEGTYFNVLIGGLGGAQVHALYDMPESHDGRVRGTEGDYWHGNLGDGLPRLRALLQPEQMVTPCGPSPQQIDIMWPEGAGLVHQDPTDGDLIYVSPREIFCLHNVVRGLEQHRPILYRAERGRGLVYEILGAADGQNHPVVTPASIYDIE